MNELPDSFRDRLLGAEKPSASLKKKYDEEVRKMLEQKLNLPMKAVFTASSVFAAACAIFFAYLAIALHGLPILARA